MPRPTKGYERSAKRTEILGAQAQIRRFAAKLPAGRGMVHPPQQLTDTEVAQVLFLDSLRSARRAQKLSQNELAVKVGVSQTTIARIETGQVSPTLSMVFRIAAALGLNISAN